MWCVCWVYVYMGVRNGVRSCLFLECACLRIFIFFVWQMHYPLWMTALVGFLPETMQSYQCELHEMGYSLSF